MMTTRERVLQMIRHERERQIQQYGSNANLARGFGSKVSSCPWLVPYAPNNAQQIETAFRENYEQYERDNGEVTWMHLIREEVAELFASRYRENTIDEAIQVAALCVSLVEVMLDYPEGEPR